MHSGSSSSHSDPVLLLAQEIDAPDRSVIATDAAGTIRFWGTGAETLYGWSAAEVLGRAIVDVTPSDLSRVEAESIMQMLQQGEPWSGEFLVRGRDNSRFTVRVTNIPVHDRHGELIGIVGISRRSSYMRTD